MVVKGWIKIVILLITVLSISCSSKSKEEMKALEIIKNTYEGKNSEENGKNLKAYLASNASWTEAEGFPYAGTYHGFDEIAQNVFERLATEWIDYKFVPEDYVANADKVVAYGTYYGTYRETNKSFKARVAHVWKLENGKIVSFEQFVDSKPVVDAMH